MTPSLLLSKLFVEYLCLDMATTEFLLRVLHKRIHLLG